MHRAIWAVMVLALAVGLVMACGPRAATPVPAEPLALPVEGILRATEGCHQVSVALRDDCEDMAAPQGEDGSTFCLVAEGELCAGQGSPLRVTIVQLEMANDYQPGDPVPAKGHTGASSETSLEWSGAGQHEMRVALMPTEANAPVAVFLQVATLNSAGAEASGTEAGPVVLQPLPGRGEIRRLDR